MTDSEIGSTFGPTLQTVAADASATTWHGALLTFSDRAAGATISQLAWTVRRVLTALAEADADARAALRADIGAPEWWFRFAGNEFLVLTFAPAYPASHPRHSPGDETVLLFQPHAAFAARRPPGSESFPKGTKNVIRAAYRDAGQPYDEALAASKREALKFVKPLRAEDPPVRWWEATRPPD